MREAWRSVHIPVAPIHRPMAVGDNARLAALNVRILNRYRLARPIGIEVDLLRRISQTTEFTRWGLLM